MKQKRALERSLGRLWPEGWGGTVSNTPGILCPLKGNRC